MRIALFLTTAVTLLLAGCDKESLDGKGTGSAARITFLADSGFTYRNDTVGLGDTLHVGVHVAAGDDRIRSFLVEVSYDGSRTGIRKDSLHVTDDPFDYNTALIMRNTAGTEQWTFICVEYDGDRTLRSLTFRVE
ncbi:MAG: hypothetical protein QM724_04550 [Flavobacteriales bacterium]